MEVTLQPSPLLVHRLDEPDVGSLQLVHQLHRPRRDTDLTGEALEQPPVGGRQPAPPSRPGAEGEPAHALRLVGERQSQRVSGLHPCAGRHHRSGLAVQLDRHVRKAEGVGDRAHDDRQDLLGETGTVQPAAQADDQLVGSSRSPNMIESTCRWSKDRRGWATNATRPAAARRSSCVLVLLEGTRGLRGCAGGDDEHDQEAVHERPVDRPLVDIRPTGPCRERVATKRGAMPHTPVRSTDRPDALLPTVPADRPKCGGRSYPGTGEATSGSPPRNTISRSVKRRPSSPELSSSW